MSSFICVKMSQNLLATIKFYLKEQIKKKQQNGRQSYKNLSDDEKNKLMEYRKTITNLEKSTFLKV